LDVQAISPDVVLRAQDVKAKADGQWTKGVGLCTITGSRASAAEALAEGLLCVLCVRDGSLAQVSPTVHPLGTIQALNVDACRSGRIAH
jgi:hypothetical protein